MLNVSWQVQNLTNTPTFTGIGTTLVPSSGGGAISPAGSFFGRVTSAGAMRTMDIMVRYNFRRRGTGCGMASQRHLVRRGRKRR